MIIFKNPAGEAFPAIGTIKRKHNLNGEKSLQGTLFDGPDVLNDIGKGWSLIFDDEPYVVTYFERNDNDGTVEFDALHKFYWDMSKQILYDKSSGSQTAKWYLDAVFKNSGYTYALNFSPNAMEKQDWGRATRLSLFNDIINSIGAEFEINGTLISIFQRVGSDLSTIVRYGFNLSDMTIESSASDFVTYGEGFGAKLNKDDENSERLHVTYESPLAKIYGKLEAEPVDDERYTIKENLLTAVQQKVDSSFSVSIKLSLHDLEGAGYPYKMAQVGDWLMAIDENLDFSQRIRIIEINDEFDADGVRLKYEVTAGELSAVDKYEQANASIASRVNEAYESASQAKQDATNALVSANGKNTSYYIRNGGTLPETANEGDLAWLEVGSEQELWIYTRLPDGSFKWIKRLDPEIGEQISQAVDETLETARQESEALKTELAKTIQAGDASSKQAVADAESRLTAGVKAVEAGIASANQEIAKARSDLTITATTLANNARAEAIATAQTNAQKLITASESKTAGLINGVQSTVDEAKAQIETVASSLDTTNKTVVNVSNRIDGVEGSIKNKVDQTTYNADQKAVDTRLVTAEHSLNGFNNTVIDLTNRVNELGQINHVVNSEFEDNWRGWYDSVAWKSLPQPSITRVAGYNGSYGIRLDASSVASDDGTYRFFNLENAGQGRMIAVPAGAKTVSWRVMGYIESISSHGNAYINGSMSAYDDAGNNLGSLAGAGTTFHKSIVGEWQPSHTRYLNLSIPSGTTQIKIHIYLRGQGTFIISQPMVVFDTPNMGKYVEGPLLNSERLSVAEQTIDRMATMVANKAEQSLVEQLAGQITQETKDRESGISALRSQTTSLIADSVKGLASETLVAQRDNEFLVNARNYTDGRESAIRSDLNSVTLLAQNAATKAQLTVAQNAIDQEVKDRISGINTLRSQTTTQITDAVKNKADIATLNLWANQLLATVQSNNLLANPTWATNSDGTLKNWVSYNAVHASGAPRTDTVTLSETFNGSPIMQLNAASTSGVLMSELIEVKPDEQIRANIVTWHDTTRYAARLWMVSYGSNGRLVSTSPSTAISIDPGKETVLTVSGNIPSNATHVAFVIANSVSGAKWSMPHISTGIDSKGVLSLAKDSFALGLADNLNAVTTGVFGNVDGITVAGKKATIDANTVVITGTAFITDAMIKDISADKIVVGTLDAAKLNVINLDAASIATGTLDASRVTIRSGTVTFGLTSNGFEVVRDNNSLRAVMRSNTWVDSSGTRTTAWGAYYGMVSPTNTNAFWAMLDPNGQTVMMYAGATMNSGTNTNVWKQTLHMYSDVYFGGNMRTNTGLWGSQSVTTATAGTLTFYKSVAGVWVNVAGLWTLTTSASDGSTILPVRIPKGYEPPYGGVRLSTARNAGISGVTTRTTFHLDFVFNSDGTINYNFTHSRENDTKDYTSTVPFRGSASWPLI